MQLLCSDQERMGRWQRAFFSLACLAFGCLYFARHLIHLPSTVAIISESPFSLEDVSSNKTCFTVRCGRIVGKRSLKWIFQTQLLVRYFFFFWVFDDECHIPLLHLAAASDWTNWPTDWLMAVMQDETSERVEKERNGLRWTGRWACLSNEIGRWR